MKVRRYVAAVAAFLAVTGILHAQNFRGGYFLDGYMYAYKLNPAFAAETDFIGPLLGQSVTSVKSPLSLKNFLFPSPDGEGLVTGLHPGVDADTFLKPLENKQNPVIAEQDFTFFSYCRKDGRRFHCFDASIRAGAAVNIPYDLFEFLKICSERRRYFDWKDTFVKSHTWMELSYGQAVTLSDRLSVGFRAKGLLGMGYASAHTRLLDVDLAQDHWWVFSESDMELAGKAFEYKTAVDDNGNETGQLDLGSIKVNPKGFLDVRGIGLSLDAGVKWQPAEGLSLSASILDLGGIKWFDSMYARTPSVEFKYEPSGIFDKQGKDNPASALGAVIMFIPQDKKKNSFDPLTATFNAGAEYRLPFYDRMSVGLLGVYKLDNIFNWYEVRGSLNASPLGWLRLTLSAGLSKYGMSYGAAALINTGVLQFFLGTDAYVSEMTPQLVPLSKLNHNFVLGLGIPLHSRT